MATFVNFLTKEEISFECKIRGYNPSGSEKVGELRVTLWELIRKEEEGHDLETDVEFDLEEELLSLNTKISKLKGSIDSLAESSVEVPEKLSGGLNHVSDRLSYHLQRCPKGEDRNRLKGLANLVLELRESVLNKVQSAKEILKKIPSFSEIGSVRRSEGEHSCIEVRDTNEESVKKVKGKYRFVVGRQIVWCAWVSCRGKQNHDCFSRTSGFISFRKAGKSKGIAGGFD